MKKLNLLSYFYSLLILIALSALPSNAVEVTVGDPNAPVTSLYYPFQRLYGGNKTQILINASELQFGAVSFISNISFEFTTNANQTPMQNFSVKMQNTTLSVLTTTLVQDGFTTVFNGPTWTQGEGIGWKTINFTEPFMWDGTSNVLVEICWTNNASNGGTGERWVRTSATPNINLVYKNQDNVANCAGFTATGTTQAQRPVMRLEVIPGTTPYITANPSSLQFNFVPAEGFSASQTVNIGGGNLNPASGAFSITPSEGFQVSVNNGVTWTSEDVTVNYVGNPIATPIPVKVRFNPLVEQVYTGTLTIEGGGATRVVNLAGTAILSYCNPTITGTTGMDIANITIGNLNNTSQAVTPTLSNTASNQTYNDFKEAQPAINAQAGTIVPYSFRLIASGTSATTSYMKVYVDLNRDGIIDPVAERVDSLYVLGTTVTAANNTFSSNIVIPPTAVVGQNTLIRFLLTTTAATQPCGSYANGETEDYWVNFTAAPPFISASPTSKDFGFVLPGVQSPATDIVVQAGTLLPAAGNLTLTPSENFAISINGGTTWATAPVNMPYTNGVLPQSIVKVRYHSPTALGLVYPGTLTITGATNIATPTVVSLMGTNMQTYPASTVSITSLIDTIDIAKVTLANLAFGAANVTPITARPEAINKYTDNRLAAPELSLFAGTTYQYTVNTFTTGTVMPLCSLGVYIDYNADGDFADAGETVSTVAIPVANNGVATGSFLVPTTAKIDTNNSPRIRFVLSTSTPSATSTTYTVGETEDYRVRVMPALPMTYVSTTTEQVGKDVFNAGVQNEKILRVKVSMNNAGNPLTLTRVVFNTNGTIPTSALNGARAFFTSDTATFNTNTPIADANLEPNGVLEFEPVNTITFKGGDNYIWLAYSVSPEAGLDAILDAELTGLYISDAPTVNKITTPQAPEGFSLVNYILPEFDGTFSGGVQAFPYQGWTNLVLYGTDTDNKWSSVTAGLNPVNTPYSAPSMAHYNSNIINTGNAAAMISPAFAMNGEIVPTALSFWLYRHQSSTSGIGSRLKVYINTTPDLTNATLLTPAGRFGADSINVRYNQGLVPEPAIGWYKYNYSIPTDFNGSTNYLIFVGSSDYYNNIHLDEVVLATDAYMVFSKIDTLGTGNSAFARPSTDNVVNAFNLRTLGSNQALEITNVKFTPEGTTNVEAIANAKVWYLGGTASFDPATSILFGTVEEIAAGQNTVVRTVDAEPITLLEGNNYFAITYDVVATATAGTIVDCKLNAVTLSRDGEPTERTITYGNTWGNHEIKLPMSGTYTVGGTPLATRWYPNLVDVVDEINLLGLSANVDIKIAGNLEIDPNDAPVFLPIEGNYNVTIYPSTNVNITSAYTGTLGMLTIGATDNITIDGRINKTGTARGLTFTNTASGRILMMTTTTAGAFINNATVKYCNFMGNLKTSSASIAVQINNGRHSDVSINNSDFKKVYYGIYMTGGSDTTKAQNLTIENNNFGDALVDANSIGLSAAYLAHADNVQFNNNTILNITNSSSFNAVNIANNITNSVFSYNKFNKIINNGTNRVGAFYVNSIANSNITFHSNSIAGINNNGTGGITYTTAAFYFNAGSNYKVLNNSVRLSGNRSTLSASVPSAPSSVVYVASTVTGLDIRNNIFVNDLVSSVTTLRNYVIYSAAPATAFTVLNNNAYYVSGSLPTIGYIGAADKVTLSDWQTATTQDASSVNTKVTFVSDMDMHLSGASACNALLNAPLADEVAFDLDGAERTNPTKMGVDEVFADFEIIGQPVSTLDQCVTLGTNNTINIPVGTFSTPTYSDGIARTFNVGDLEYSWTKNGEAIAGNSAPLQVIFNDAALPTVNDVYQATVIGLNEPFTSTTLYLSEGPAIYALSGSGSICPGSTVGVNFTLSGSQEGVSYQLRLGDTLAVGTPLLGTGSALTFANVTGIGTYKVLAFNTANPSCVATMTGAGTVNALATATVFNVTRTATAPYSIGLNSSELGASYKLYRDDVEVANSNKLGTGAALDFGVFTQAGVYTVKATKGTCVTLMNGTAEITGASGYTLSGTIKYANTAQTAMNNCVVIIKSGATEVGRATTDATGAYSVSGLANGDYTIEVQTTKAHGGINGLDVSLLRQKIGNTATFTPLQMLAGDINGNGSINGLDVAPLRLKIANTASTQWLVPNFVFYPKTITINGADSVLDIQSLCGGDVNKSFTPSGN